MRLEPGYETASTIPETIHAHVIAQHMYMTPAQLMGPGISHNAFCAAGGFA